MKRGRVFTTGLGYSDHAEASAWPLRLHLGSVDKGNGGGGREGT